MKRLIHQSRTEHDGKVRLAANQAVLKFAGVEPARKVEATTPDKVLDQMTPEELALFAAHRKWPSRFREALRAFIPASGDAAGAGVSGASAPHDGDTIDITPPKQKALPPPGLDDLPDSTLPPVE
jgi:hypothetical protein